MNIIQGLENQFATKSSSGTMEEFEKIAVDFLQGLDFTDVDIRDQAVRYVQHMITDYVEQNKPIKRLEAKIMHCITTKLVLTNLNLGNVPIIYRDRTPEDNNAGAFYNSEEKSLTFFNDNVCNPEYFLNSYGDNMEKGANSRLDYFVGLVRDIGHECNHVRQFRAVENQNDENLTPEIYIMTQQIIARVFAMAIGSKYYSENKKIDRLYNDNHNQFYYEIDADKTGIETMFEVLSIISPRACQIAINPKRNAYVDKLSETTEQLEHYGDSITWGHDSNSNNGQVLATHKSSMIISSVLPRLSSKQRKEFFDKYPSLAIVYNIDGSRKTLDQVEAAKQEKLNQVLTNTPDEEVQAEASRIESIYDTSIEGDAVLCFEKCLQHIVRLTWHSDRYFTNNGDEVRYDPATIYSELAAATQKAKSIAEYIEDADAVRIKEIFLKYKREKFKDKITNTVNQRFYEAKIRALNEIEGTFYSNKEAKQTIERDQEEAASQMQKKRMEYESAESVIKTVFPGFKPTPYTYTINEKKSSCNYNVNEVLMLMEAYNQYVRTLTRLNINEISKQDNFIPTRTLYLAIKSLYSVEPTPEQIAQFKKDLSEGKIKVVSNKYIPMADQINIKLANSDIVEQPAAKPTAERAQTRTQQTVEEYDNQQDKQEGVGLSR